LSHIQDPGTCKEYYVAVPTWASVTSSEFTWVVYASDWRQAILQSGKASRKDFVFKSIVGVT